jgi:hypothetical protein
MKPPILTVTTQEREKAEFADFEIVPGQEQSTHAVSSWPALRFFFLGFVALALTIVVLLVGALILVSRLILVTVARSVSSRFFHDPKKAI